MDCACSETSPLQWITLVLIIFLIVMGVIVSLYWIFIVKKEDEDDHLERNMSTGWGASGEFVSSSSLSSGGDAIGAGFQ